MEAGDWHNISIIDMLLCNIMYVMPCVWLLMVKISTTELYCFWLLCVLVTEVVQFLESFSALPSGHGFAGIPLSSNITGLLWNVSFETRWVLSSVDWCLCHSLCLFDIYAITWMYTVYNVVNHRSCWLESTLLLFPSFSFSSLCSNTNRLTGRMKIDFSVATLATRTMLSLPS